MSERNREEILKNELRDYLEFLRGKDNSTKRRAAELLFRILNIESELSERKNREEIELSILHPGDKFKIGKHDFIVLEQMNGQTAVISKGFMAENVAFDEDTKDYNKSSLKKLIEEKIQPEIEKEIGADNLVEHEVHPISVDGQTKFKPVKCKVRPISFDEVRKFNSLVVNEKLPDWYWTLTPWSSKKRGYRDRIVAAVSPSGDFDILNCDCATGVRPFCILKSNIFVSKGE